MSNDNKRYKIIEWEQETSDWHEVKYLIKEKKLFGWSYLTQNIAMDGSKGYVMFNSIEEAEKCIERKEFGRKDKVRVVKSI